MALYDGFFDAVLNEETGEYDRAYSSGDFTDYFGQIIGSGVCIHDNPDSFLVRLEDGAAVVHPGYLFIQGYWLKNDADYTMELSGPAAIVAHLNLGKKMIELEARSVSSSYSDALVLAMVTPEDGAAVDTRYNTDLCGVIDSAGGLANKVQYAIDYINNQIEDRLAQIEADIAAQEKHLTAKIAEVQSIADSMVPPPIGTIKFSASQDVGPEWLRCNGDFISESQYPELVAALGKLTPGVEDFSEILGVEQAEQVSNHCLVDGTTWIYLVKSKKLVGLSKEGRKEIAVSGAEEIVESASIDAVLSVCGDAVYLAQNNYSENTFVLLEFANFSGIENSITMTRLDVMSKADTSTNTKTNFLNNCYPSVVDVLGTKYMVLGLSFPYYSSQTINNDGYIHSLKWKSGDFTGSATRFSTIWASASSGNNPYLGIAKGILSVCAFSKKNSNELVSGYIMAYNYTYSSQFAFQIFSTIQGIFGICNVSTAPTISATSGSEENKALYAKIYEKFYTKNEEIPKNIIPATGNSEYLWGCEIRSGKAVIYYGKYNPQTIFDWKTIPISLPSRARLFRESVVYASSQGLWFIFVGTGLLFSESLENGEWGYLDTSQYIGIITQFGCLDYDASTNTLYISGADTSGLPVIWKLGLPDLYNYANDGAWLPLIASDGVPAYIKAKEEPS